MSETYFLFLVASCNLLLCLAGCLTWPCEGRYIDAAKTNKIQVISFEDGYFESKTHASYDRFM